MGDKEMAPGGRTGSPPRRQDEVGKLTPSENGGVSEVTGDLHFGQRSDVDHPHTGGGREFGNFRPDGLTRNTAKIGSGRQRQPLRLQSQSRLRCASSQRPCIWKSPLYEFEVPASYGPASTGLAMIDRAATAARISLVMAFAPSRVGSAPGFASAARRWVTPNRQKVHGKFGSSNAGTLHSLMSQSSSCRVSRGSCGGPCHPGFDLGRRLGQRPLTVGDLEGGRCREVVRPLHDPQPHPCGEAAPGGRLVKKAASSRDSVGTRGLQSDYSRDSASFLLFGPSGVPVVVPRRLDPAGALFFAGSLSGVVAAAGAATAPGICAEAVCARDGCRILPRWIAARPRRGRAPGAAGERVRVRGRWGRRGT